MKKINAPVMEKINTLLMKKINIPLMKKINIPLMKKTIYPLTKKTIYPVILLTLLLLVSCKSKKNMVASLPHPVLLLIPFIRIRLTPLPDSSLPTTRNSKHWLFLKTKSNIQRKRRLIPTQTNPTGCSVEPK